VHNRLDKTGFLSHPFRVGDDATVSVVRQAEPVEQRIDASGHLGRFHAAQSAVVFKLFAGGELLVDRR
jgi:hypothetical protein